MNLTTGAILLALLLAFSSLALAEQIDIHGPPGSWKFGTKVALLPNGNIVVTDPWYYTVNAIRAGAVHLYDPAGTLISSLTGSTNDDYVGGGQIVILANGNFVVSTPNWNNGIHDHAGAVTWINGTSGLSGVVSAENSLVGTSSYDTVGGYDGVVALTNGHYVVASTSWDDGDVVSAGAVTWGDGNSGIVGTISASNSLVGTETYDSVGQDQNLWGSAIVALPNGNYVVPSMYWHYPTRKNYGAITWGDGQGGTVGPVSEQNSLVGTTDCSSDQGGPSQVTVLSNSDFLVSSPCWSSTLAEKTGAVTWADGSAPTMGTVTAANSLIGQFNYDRVGMHRATVLTNGNYVVVSSGWNRGVGAATWIDGSQHGLKGVVSEENSLLGSKPGDYAGIRVTALTNGNYVVGMWGWSSPAVSRTGAVTWADGTTGLVGRVTPGNSLIGSTENDVIGFSGITALSNGNYVVASPSWSDGELQDVGAVTLLDGNGPTVGVVSPGNSLIGGQANDYVGYGRVTALPNGSFVISSPDWTNDEATKAGAVTWAVGTTMLSGTVTPENSLVGTTADDRVGNSPIVVLKNGNYVVASPYWSSADGIGAGAATWADGSLGLSGAISSANSSVGTYAYNRLGLQLTALSDGNYLFAGANGGGSGYLSSLTLANGQVGATGNVQPWNTLFADIGYPGINTNFPYDASRERVVVGQPEDNVVTLFSIADLIFAGSFE